MPNKSSRRSSLLSRLGQTTAQIATSGCIYQMVKISFETVAKVSQAVLMDFFCFARRFGGSHPQLNGILI
jgi:hypothetical protein